MFDPISLLVLAIALGAGGFIVYEKVHKADSTGGTGGGTGNKPPATTGGTVFGAANCQAQYNALPPEAKQQVDNAVAQAKSQGGAAGAATLTSAAGILRAGYPALADCLQALATKFSGGTAPGGTGTQQPLGSGSAAAYLSGQCLALYNGLDPLTRAQIDQVVDQAKTLGTGAAAYIQQYAALIAGVNPQLSACVATIATAIGAGSGTGGTGGTSGGVVVSAGAAFFSTEPCAGYYKALSDADKLVVDDAVKAAQAAGGGPGGAQLLMAAASYFQAGNANMYACLVSAATVMNGGTVPDSAIAHFDPGTMQRFVVNPTTSKTVFAHGMSYRNVVGVTGAVPALRGPVR
jgi:hypothetical protein